MNRVEITDEMVTRMRLMRQGNLLYEEIGEVLGIHRTTVSRYLNPDIQDRHIQYNKSHPKEHAIRNKRYKKDHKAELAVYNKCYSETHPAQASAKSARRRAAKSRALIALTDEERTQITELYRRARKDKAVKCYLCGKRIPLGHRHVDHVMPLTKGGKHHPCNLAITCDSCNSSKSAKLPSEVGLLL